MGEKSEVISVTIQLPFTTKKSKERDVAVSRELLKVIIRMNRMPDCMPTEEELEDVLNTIPADSLLVLGNVYIHTISRVSKVIQSR